MGWATHRATFRPGRYKSGMDKALAQEVTRGAYVVDPQAVAAAMLERPVLRMLISAQTAGLAPVAVPEDEPAPLEGAA